MNNEELKNGTNNKRGKIIIGGFVLLFFILLGMATYGIYVLRFKKPSQITPSQFSTSTPVSIEKFTSVGEREFELCQKVDYDKTPHYGKQTKDVFYKIAEIMANKDENACNELGDNKNLCLSHYYTFLTIKEKIPDYLDKLKQLKEDISLGNAYIKQDLSLCEKINDDAVEKNICKTMTDINPAFCEFSDSEYKTNSCLSVNDEKGIKSGCTINKMEAKSLCLNSFYLVKAFKEKKLDECSKIDNVTGRFTRLYCLGLLSSNYKEEINKFYQENACYEKYATLAAQTRNDPSLCEKIPLKDSHNKIEYENCVNQFK